MENVNEFEAHFRRIGASVGKRSFDTAEAVQVGRTVASELRGASGTLSPANRQAIEAVRSRTAETRYVNSWGKCESATF
jgi:hypothetical protein